MKEEGLWQYFWSKKEIISKPFDRYFIWVTRNDFETARSLFTSEYNLFHPKSYRSSGYIRHVHAIDEGDYFCIHKDVGNWKRFSPLLIIHFLVDVLPCMIFCFFKKIPIESLTVPPKDA